MCDFGQLANLSGVLDSLLAESICKKALSEQGWDYGASQHYLAAISFINVLGEANRPLVYHIHYHFQKDILQSAYPWTLS